MDPSSSKRYPRKQVSRVGLSSRWNSALRAGPRVGNGAGIAKTGRPAAPTRWMPLRSCPIRISASKPLQSPFVHGRNSTGKKVASVEKRWYADRANASPLTPIIDFLYGPIARGSECRSARSFLKNPERRRNRSPCKFCRPLAYPAGAKTRRLTSFPTPHCRRGRAVRSPLLTLGPQFRNTSRL